MSTKAKTAAKAKKPARRTTKPATNSRSTSADTTATRCSACGSTERTPYQQKKEIETTGLAPDGKPATHIRLGWTKCTACEQHRIDRTYLNRN